MDTLGMGVLLGFGGAMVVFMIIGFIEYIAGEPDISDIVKEYITSAPLRKLFALRRIMDEVIEERLAEKAEKNEIYANRCAELLNKEVHDDGND